MRPILHVSQYFCDDRDTLSPQVWLRDCTALCSASQVTLEKGGEEWHFQIAVLETSFVATASNLVRGAQALELLRGETVLKNNPRTTAPFLPAFQRYRN
jgi:hypothetical protein